MRRRILKSSINIRCTSDVITQLDALADEANQHRSELVRRAIILLIQSHEGLNATSPLPASHRS
jgi:metal-responsive CopG/Arc/MetJ family transcriptional regulator